MAQLTWTNATATISGASTDTAVTATTATEGDRGLGCTTAGITVMRGSALVIMHIVAATVGSGDTAQAKLLVDGTENARWRVSGTTTATGTVVGILECAGGEVLTLGVSNETDGDDCSDFDAYLDVVMVQTDNSAHRTPIAR